MVTQRTRCFYFLWRKQEICSQVIQSGCVLLRNMHLTMGFSIVRLSRDAGGFVRQEIMITMHPMSVVMAQLLLEEIMSPVNVELSDLRCG